jgi:hypothetical protein
VFRLRHIEADSSMAIELSATPRYLGRAPTNDLVIADRSVSARHAAVFTSGGRVFVEDLGSRNGTFVGERRVKKICEIRPDEELVLGGVVRLRIEGHPGPGAPDRPLLMLEQLDGSVRVPLHDEQLRIGPDSRADLWIPELEAPMELRITKDRGWLGTEPVRLGETFLIGAKAFRIVPAAPILSVTLEPEPAGPQYSLKVELSGATGPKATAPLEWTAPNRVVLLYLLAKRLDADLRAGVGPGERGWCRDSEIAAGLWGRDGVDRNLNVLVTRVRNDLRRAGLDPWVIEKRQAHVRVRVARVEVDP